MRIKIFTILAGAILFVSCDKVCHSTTNDVAVVHNLTGRELSLVVCKLTGTKQQIQIAANQVNAASLGQGTKETIQGGGDALKSCSNPSGQTQTVGFSLSSESFNDVTLCQDTVTLDYTVVERSQACPSGNQSQSNPVNCP